MGIPRTALVNAPRPARGGSGDHAHDPGIATALRACMTVGSSWGWSSPEAASVQCAGRHAVRVTRGNGSRVSALALATRNAPFGVGTVLQPGGSVCPPLTWSARAREECRPGTSPLFLAGAHRHVQCTGCGEGCVSGYTAPFPGTTHVGSSPRPLGPCSEQPVPMAWEPAGGQGRQGHAAVRACGGVLALASPAPEGSLT